MFKLTPKKRVLFVRRFMPVLLVIFGVFSLLALNVQSPKLAEAATANTINFQARLQSAAGNIVPDGNYNVEFKLYSASSGGTALWTEDYYNNASNGIQAINGYVTANLGSVTPFPTTINWDQPLWLTMNIGGTTTGTPTLDGEMNPRLALTAVPYAFRAGQLATTNGAGTYTSTLSIQAPTNGTQNFVIQDQGAAGTYNLLTNNSGVQLQTSTPGTAQTGNLNISGTAVVGSLLSNTFDSSSGGITIGGSTATSVSIGGTNTTGLSFNVGGSMVASLGSNGAALFKSSSATGFVIQDASSTNLVAVNTSANQINLGNGATTLAIANTGGNTAWITNANALPTNLRGASSVTANGYVYSIGGYNGSTIANVYYAKINADGSLGSWVTSSNSLPSTRDYASAVVANGYVYVMGGETSGGALQTTVFYAKLNTDGTIGAWSTNTNSLPATRGYGNATVANGYIYFVGGYQTGYLNSTTYAKINADGSTGVWTTSGVTLPNGISAAGFGSLNGYLFLAGGYSGGSNQTTVYSNKPNADGSLNSWVVSANPLPTARTNFESTVANGYMYVIGGDIGGVYQSTVFYAKLNADGTNGTWASSANSLVDPRQDGSAVNANGYIYVLGGRNSSGSQSTVYYSALQRTSVNGTVTFGGNVSGLDAVNTNEFATLGQVNTLVGTAVANSSAGAVSLQGSTPGTAQTGNFNISGTGTAGTFNATSTLQTAGVTRVDSSGNLTNIGNITGTGNLQLSGTTGSSYILSALGLGTSNPQASSALTIGNSSWISSIDSTGTGYVNMFQVNSNNQIQVGAALSVDGGIILPTNGGQLTFSDLPIDATAAAGTKESYSLRVGSTNALTVYGEADGSGNSQNVRVSVGSSIAPSYTLDVGGDVNTTGAYRQNGTQGLTQAACAAGSVFSATTAGGIVTGGSCTAVAAGTTASYIQNGTSLQASSNFNISGTGVVGVALQVAAGGSIDTSAAGTLNIGTANASTVNIATNGVAHTIAIGNGAAIQGVTIGSSNTTSSLLLQAGTGSLSIQTQGGILGIGNNAIAQTINIGNITGATAVSINAGTGNLSLGSGGVANTIQIGNASGAVAQTLNIGTNPVAGSTNTVTLGSGAGTSTTTIQSGSGGINLTQAGGGGIISKSNTGSSSAFQLQNSLSNVVFNVDTNNSTSLIQNPSFDQNTSGWVAFGTGASIARNITKNQTYSGNTSLAVTLGSSAGTGAQITSSAIFFGSLGTGNYTLSFYAKGQSTISGLAASFSGGGTCTLNNTNVLSTGFQRYSCNVTTSSATTSINITASTTGAILYLDSVQVDNSSSAGVFSTGTILLRGVVGSPLTIQNSSNSTSAFQIQNAAGTSNLFVADTLNSRVGIGTNAPAYTLDVAGDINSSTGLRIGGNLVCTSSGCTSSGGGTAVNLQATTPGTPQTGNLNISGVAITGSLQSASLDTASAGTLAIGATNATTLNIGGGSAAQTLNVGNGSGNDTVNIATGTGTDAINIGSTGDSIQLQGTTMLGNAGSGTTLFNNGATVNTTLALGNFTSGGAIGSAATTVDIYTGISVAQTTSGQSLTVPTPTVTTNYGKMIYLSNIGTQNFTLLGTPLKPGATATLVWSNTNGGASWQYAGSDSNGILNQSGSTQTGDFNISGTGTAATLNATTGLQTAGTTRLDSSGNLTNISNITATGITQLRTFTNSGIAFQIQNSASTSIFTADTTSAMSITTAVGNLSINGIANPATPTLATTGTTGTLAAATYYYKLAAQAPNTKQTTAVVATPAFVTTTGTTSKNTLSWSAVPNAANYVIYRSTDGGVTWKTNTVSAATLSLVDDGTAYTWGTTATPNNNNQTGGVSLQTDTLLTLDGGNGNYLANIGYQVAANALVIGNYNTTGAVTIQGNSFSVQDTTGYNSNLYIANTGATTFKNRVNSTTAFQIQNASSVSLFNVDSTTGTITLGTGGNTVSFTAAGGLVAAGTAQHTKNIVLTPEYAGAALDAASDSGGTVNCSTANSGIMTSGFNATARQNYYNWTVSGATAQCYDVVVQVPLPSDWSSWNGAGTLYTYNSVGSDTSSVMVDAYDTTGTHDGGFTASTYSGVTSTTTFGSQSLPTFSGTYTAGGYMTLKIRVTSNSAKNVRIGNITLNYNSQY